MIRELRRHIDGFRDGAGPDVHILLDLNYNASPEGYRRILRALDDFDLFWVEIETEYPEALADVRATSPHAIASCESLLTLRPTWRVVPAHQRTGLAKTRSVDVSGIAS